MVTAISSDTTLIPNANLVLGGSGANRSIIVTPAPNAYGGPVTVTVSVSDGVNTTLETLRRHDRPGRGPSRWSSTPQPIWQTATPRRSTRC